MRTIANRPCRDRDRIGNRGAVDDIEFDEGVFAIAGTDRSVTIKEVARAAANPVNLPDGMEPGQQPPMSSW